MAKRAKATRAAAARPKAEAAEPFYRPFSKLKAPSKPKAARSTGHDGGSSGPPPARPAPLPPVRRAAEPESGAPPPVDPETFAIYMTGVRALPDDRAHRIPQTASRIERSARPVVTEDPDADARGRMRSLVSEGIRFETVDDGDRLEGRRLDVDPRELRRLRRGQYAVDGKLDLHGLGTAEARQAVEAFIKKRALDGDRVVLVIHGKGSHSPRGHAVLRGEIAAWLSQGRSSRHIAAFTNAADGAARDECARDDQGPGAVLVLLAR
jgi:DNA-nicking Smr family endonuclease